MGRGEPGGYDLRVDAMLGNCSLELLRQRTSMKWRTFPADVLPAFVAEMDFDIAEPIKDAVRAALDAGDVGYAHKGRVRSVAPPRTRDAAIWSGALPFSTHCSSAPTMSNVFGPSPPPQWPMPGAMKSL